MSIARVTEISATSPDSFEAAVRDRGRPRQCHAAQCDLGLGQEQRVAVSGGAIQHYQGTSW